MASGGMDGKVCVWKVDNGEFVTSVEGPDEVIVSKGFPVRKTLIELVKANIGVFSH